MRNDHRRPLVAYGFVSLACALVVGQPSLSSLAGEIPGRAPVVTLLTDTGLDARQLLDSVFGLPTINAIRASVGEIPDDDVVTPGVDPIDDLLGGTSGDPGVIVADGPAPQSGPPLSAGLTDPGGGGTTPGTGTPGGGDGGPPDDGGLFGTPGPDTPRGGKGNGVDVDGPMPHQFGSGKDHPYDTAQTPGSGGSGGGQDGDKPGQGPKDKGPKDKGPKDKGDKPGKGPKDKGPKDNGPKDKGDKPGKGPKDKGDKPGKGSKDKGDKPGKGSKDKGQKRRH